MRSRKALFVIVLSLLGLGDSIWTLYTYNKLIGTNFAYKSFCAISEFVNCDVVITSPFGKILGIHNSAYGIIAYLALLSFSMIFYFSGIPSGKRYFSWLFLVSLFTSMFSLYLFLVSLFSIHSLCILCIGLYVVNFSMLGISIAGAKGESINPFLIVLNDAFLSFRRYPLLAVSGLAVFSAGVIALYIYDDIRIKKDWRERYSYIFTGKAKGYEMHIDDSVSRGLSDAAVTIVEFSDFECPFCREANAVMEKIFDEYSPRIKTVFKNFPLDSSCNPFVKRSSHRNACLAAVAGLCAEEQDMFWKYKKLLFDNQDRLGYGELLMYAGKTGMDTEKFKACLSSPESGMARIKKDIIDGMNLEIESTPTFFINGKKIRGSIPLWFFREIVENELKGSK
ncbi:MAG TPA: thioredoxin domain-containing protein [bacterium]